VSLVLNEEFLFLLSFVSSLFVDRLPLDFFFLGKNFSDAIKTG